MYAAGGIQSARLLQFSGLDESSVGRCFSVHPHPSPYAYLILDEDKFRSLADKPPSGPYGRWAIALSSEFSKVHGLLSVTSAVPKDGE